MTGIVILSSMASFCVLAIPIVTKNTFYAIHEYRKVLGFIAIAHEWFSLGTSMCSCTGLQEKEERKGCCFQEALSFLVYHKARVGLAAHTSLRPPTLTTPAPRELLIEPQSDLGFQ